MATFDSALLSQRVPGQPPSEAMMEVLTRLAMVSVFGLAIGSHHQGVGED